MLPREELTAILSAATTFVCPSVYEPLGIVNLEAMACETPVVGSGTGGIPEVVTHGEVGTIVPIEQLSDGTASRLIRKNSFQISPRHSTRWSLTPSVLGNWDEPRASGLKTIFLGTLSPSAR